MPDPSFSELPDWREALSTAVTDIQKLLDILGLEAGGLGLSQESVKDFPLRVPRPYLDRIERGNPRDPLLLQILPDRRESWSYPGFGVDPLGERDANPAPGLLRKYRGRALLIAAAGCAVHCRYCFRRHFPYSDNNPGKKQWRESLRILAEDKTINEVILSGGDPLVLTDGHLAWLLEELAAIPHLAKLRIHTRLPIVIPQRVTPSLCDLLANSRFQTILVMHGNHAREFDPWVDEACLRLKAAGATLLNQSVLLKDVNDSCSSLVQLSERMFEAGVLPYYLHLLDKVAGAGHFDCSPEKAVRLVREMQKQLPGYLVPRLVRETAGAESKTLISL